LATNRKILVIDDEGPIRRVIELKLRNKGYDVITATNGADGLELVHSEKPDVVITDIMMPKLDGKGLCEQTNGLKEERPFLTIVVTCRVSPEERSWTGAMRDTVLMEKPFSPSILLECVEQYLSSEEC
jgi:DNA-binding response OmpR family regulator